MTEKAKAIRLYITALCIILLVGCSSSANSTIERLTDSTGDTSSENGVEVDNQQEEFESSKTGPRIEFKEKEITKRTDTKYNCPEYTVYPADTNTDNIVWTSTDESIAKVENGMLYAGKEGTAQITATLDDNTSASMTVNVESKTKKASTSPYGHSSSGSSSIYLPKSSWTTGGPGAGSMEKSTSKSSSQEYQNALTKGLQYANQLHMSKKAIYDQLTSSYGEGFPADAAQYAIDNMTGVDWNANALAKAQEYYTMMSMSKSAVYDQLTSEYGEQFTASEARYAIDHLN